MKFSILFLFLFSFFLPDLISQTTLTGVVKDSLNKPVPFASVYLSKTTIGTLTDNNGAFSLNIPHDGANEMITSCVGYQSNSQVIYADGKRQTINIKLYVNLVLVPINIYRRNSARTQNRHESNNMTAP
jgi:outer membrane receptor for ferrienterochelin and colicins